MNRDDSLVVGGVPGAIIGFQAYDSRQDDVISQEVRMYCARCGNSSQAAHVWCMKQGPAGPF